MYSFTVSNFDEWRSAARNALVSGVPPEAIQFHDRSDQTLLFASEELSFESHSSGKGGVPVVSHEFLELAKTVACHADDDRFQLLYRILWRLTTSEPKLLEMVTDDDVYRLHAMEKAIHRDVHKMHAFVRFRKVSGVHGEQFIAWHRPDHRIVRLASPFFARRFPAMNWTIFTPDESVTWDGQELVYGPGVPQDAAPQTDDLEDLWRTYYGSIFNPARIKLKTMKREMPVRHWKTLPETEIIDQLLADAPRRVEEMIARQEGYAKSATDYFPQVPSWENLRASIVDCQACDLYRSATQPVFGEGLVPARLMFVGEQPGDVEDQKGRPFIGPAGQILNAAMQQAGLDRADAYLTNTVKHFKFEPQGTRRLHKRPGARETSACRPWVEAEIAFVQPEVLVCLGATASHALIGRDFNVTRQRGQFIKTEWCENTISTYHPSAVLRDPNSDHAAEVMAALVSDLQLVKGRLDEAASRPTSPE